MRGLNVSLEHCFAATGSVLDHVGILPLWSTPTTAVLAVSRSLDWPWKLAFIPGTSQGKSSTIERDPSHTETTGCGEHRLWRRTNVWRAVMPHHHQPTIVAGTSVVGVNEHQPPAFPSGSAVKSIHMTVTVSLWMSATKKSKVLGIVLLAVAPICLMAGAVFRNPFPIPVALVGLGLVPLASKLATGAKTWDEAVEHRRARNRAGGSWPHDLTWLGMAIFGALWLMGTVAVFLEKRSAASQFLRYRFAPGPAWVHVADLLLLAGGALFVMLSIGLPVLTMLGAWRRTRWGNVILVVPTPEPSMPSPVTRP